MFITCPTSGENSGRYVLASDCGRTAFFLSHADALRTQQAGTAFRSWYTLPREVADAIRAHPRFTEV